MANFTTGIEREAEAQIAQAFHEARFGEYRTELCGLCGQQAAVDRNGDFYHECSRPEAARQ